MDQDEFSRWWKMMFGGMMQCPNCKLNATPVINRDAKNIVWMCPKHAMDYVKPPKTVVLQMCLVKPRTVNLSHVKLPTKL